MTDIVPGDRHGPRNVVVIGWLVLLAGIGRLLMAARRGQCRPPYGWLFWMVRTRRGWGGLGRWYRGTVMTVPYIIDLLDNGGGGSVLHWVVVMAGRRGQCRPPYGWLFWMVRTRRGWGGLGRWYRGTVMTVPYIIDLLDNGGGGSVLHWVVVVSGLRGQCRPPYGWLFWMVRICRGRGAC